MHDISHDTPTGGGQNTPVGGDQLARQEAIKQIERRRRFWVSTAAWTVVMILVAVVWAISEYHNAGGWPTNGFSQSSGIPNAWNYWIIYPFIAWVLGTAAGAWWVYGRKPVSEREIQREIERQAGRR
jgi:H+/Cl- antiporter ClcA